MNTSIHNQLLSQLLTAAEQKYGALDLELRRRLVALSDTEALEALLDDLRLFPTSEAFHRSVAYFSGREVGKIQGMRDAIDTLMLDREDEAAEEIGDAAFSCSDILELEKMLIELARLAPPYLN